MLENSSYLISIFEFAKIFSENCPTKNGKLEDYNYEKFNVSNIRNIEPEKYYMLSGIIKELKIQYIKQTKKYIINVIIEDATGRITCKFFGNPAIFKKIMKPEANITVSGKVSYYNAYWDMEK